MTNENTILADIDPEIAARVSQPGSFKNAALKLGVLATAPLVIAAASTAAFGQGAQLPRKIAEVLNFALTLEYLEDDFYRTALASDKLIPSETRATFETIGKHEAAHVEVLKAALGSHAVKKPTFTSPQRVRSATSSPTTRRSWRSPRRSKIPVSGLTRARPPT